MQRLSVSLFVLCCLVLCGCDKAPETRVVSGTVTLDGEPLNDAYVEFSDADSFKSASMDISEGKFSGNVQLGEKTLRFFATRAVKPNPRLPATDLQVLEKNILPRRYGYESTIKLSVESEDLLDLKYELESK